MELLSGWEKEGGLVTLVLHWMGCISFSCFKGSAIGVRALIIKGKEQLNGQHFLNVLG